MITGRQHMSQKGGKEEKRKKGEGRVLGRKGWLHVDLVRGCHKTAGSVS